MTIRKLPLLFLPAFALFNLSACISDEDANADAGDDDDDDDADDDDAEEEGDDDDDDDEGDDDDDDEEIIEEEHEYDAYPVLQAPCRFPAAEPSRLAVSSTDNNTGAIGLVDTGARTIETDLALAATDIAMAVDGDELYVINRFGYDYIDILDLQDDLGLLAQFKVELEAEVSANPHSLHVTADQEAYVTAYGGPALQVFDVSDPEAPEKTREVDFSPFADDDGVPEIGKLIACGEVLFTSVERLDRNGLWAPVDKTYLVPFHVGEDEFFEFDDENEGGDGFALLGIGVTQVRADPEDESGHTALVLNSGLERVNLADGSSEWVIADTAFEAAGFSRYNLRSFDVGDDGMVYLALAVADWSQHHIYRASLDGQGADLELIASNLQTVTGALEVVGDHVWFADTTIGASGLRVFDVSKSPAEELKESPIATGLPPYGLLPIK